ncbi:MAG: hypothetical protein JW749_00590 [Sedimentisphaerales bacterium]|nr:hypothetical protein [Sedimentisphaerales bacterium]
MSKKQILRFVAVLLAVAVLSVPGYAGMTADRVPIAQQWPDYYLPGWTREVYTYYDPASATAWQEGWENFNSGRGLMQTFTVQQGADGFTLGSIVIAGRGPGSPTNEFSLHIFDINTAKETNDGEPWQDTHLYKPAYDTVSVPEPAYDWFSTDCNFIFWPDENEPPLNYFVIFSFTGYDRFDLEPNHLYAFEIWGPYETLSVLYLLHDYSYPPPYPGGRAYCCRGDEDGPLPGVGPSDLSAKREGWVGGLNNNYDFVLGVYGVRADGKAFHPLPRNYEPEAEVTPVLKWSPGKWVADTEGHRLWLSTAKPFVDNRMPGANKGKMDDCEYSPGELASLTTYYWAVDEYNSVSKPGSYWRGPTWRFKTWADFCDLHHSPLGNAQLDIDSNGLTVSNIGTSGNDGVKIDIDDYRTDVTYLHVNCRDIGDLNQFPIGTFIEVTSRGTVNGEPNQVVSVVRHEYTEPAMTTTVDFSTVQPASLTAKYYYGGQLVLTESNIDPIYPIWYSVWLLNSFDICWWRPPYPYTLPILVNISWDFCHIWIPWPLIPPWPPWDPWEPWDPWPDWPPPYIMTPLHNTVRADKVIVDAVDINVPFDGYKDISVRVKDIPSITITDETKWHCSASLGGDINADCKVDLYDVKEMCDGWLTSDIKADITRDGNVTFEDYSKLAQNWCVDCNADPNNSSCEPWP